MYWIIEAIIPSPIDSTEAHPKRWFGPFPSKGRAAAYAKSFPHGWTYEVLPLIKPFNV